MTVVLPAFQEAENIGPLLEEISAVVRREGIPNRIVVVDDGSTDGTGAMAESYRRRLAIDVVAHSRNLGLAAAVNTGIATALPSLGEDDVLVIMDADNTQPASLIPSLVRAISSGADIVIASRYAPGGGQEGVPWLRRILSRGAAMLMRLRFGLPNVRDYTCGYRAYRAGLIRAALERSGNALIQSEGFAVMAELLVKLGPLHPRITEIPLRLRYDLKRGQSKIRLLRTVGEYFALMIPASLTVWRRTGRSGEGMFTQ